MNSHEHKFILKNLITASPVTAPAAPFSDEAVRKLIRQSTDPALDSEQAEWHTSGLAWALADVGDERFSALLAREPRKTQRATSRSLRLLWTSDKALQYPRTRALVEAATANPAEN